MTEEKFEQAIENFFTWSWQVELIVSGICAAALLLTGLYLLKKGKKNAGWICAGLGVVLLTDIARLAIQVIM
jgi:hypothetical protein